MYASDHEFKWALHAQKSGDTEDAERYLRRYCRELEALRPYDEMVFGKFRLCGGIKPNPVTVEMPISWIVLAREGTRMLLTSKFCLDWECYDGYCVTYAPDAQTTWETSTIRRELNKDFFGQAFSEEEKKLILTTEVRTEDNPAYRTKGGNVTYDKVFLLSREEVIRYFGENSRNRCEARADLMMADESYPEKGTIILERQPHFWWLRSPGETPCKAACVDPGGWLDLEGLAVDADEIGIRPAIWIDWGELKKERE